MSATLRCVHIVTALLALTLLSACSRSPDAGDAQKALEAEMRNAHLDGLLEVTDVETVSYTHLTLPTIDRV